MLNEVERRIAWEKGQEHGTFNYTDLLVLSENGVVFKTVKSLMLEFSKVLPGSIINFYLEYSFNLTPSAGKINFDPTPKPVVPTQCSASRSSRY